LTLCDNVGHRKRYQDIVLQEIRRCTVALQLLQHRGTVFATFTDASQRPSRVSFACQHFLSIVGLLPFPGNGMGLNPCVPHGTSGFYTELYKNHSSGECVCHFQPITTDCCHRVIPASVTPRTRSDRIMLRVIVAAAFSRHMQRCDLRRKFYDRLAIAV